MRPGTGIRSVGAILVILGAAAACSDATGPSAAATTGSVTVSVFVTGWAQSGVQVRLLSPAASRAGPTDTTGLARFNGVPVGEYTLELDGLDPDARFGDLPPVRVVADVPASVRLEGVFDPGRFVDVRVGGGFICALNQGGNAYCWGLGESGELGNGSYGLKGIPSRVRSPTRFTDITAGLFHACGLSAAGKAFCWGSNASGRLGRGLEFTELEASALPAPVAGAHVLTDLEAAAGSTCGLEAGTGLAHCWGSAAAGVLGTDEGGAALSPGPVATGVAFAELIANDAWAGDLAVGARTEDGRVWLWGAVRETGTSWLNFTGPTPAEVPLPGPARFATSLCAWLLDESVYCWPNLEGDVPAEVLAELEVTAQPGLFRYRPDGLDERFLRAGMPCSFDGQGFVCLRDWFQEMPRLDFRGEEVLSVSTRGYSGCAVTDLGRVYCWEESRFQASLVAGPGA